MANPWKMVLNALPSSPVTEGTVSAVHDDGTATVASFRGGTMRCKNPVGAQIGDEVEVQDQIQRVLEGMTTHYITI